MFTVTTLPVPGQDCASCHALVRDPPRTRLEASIKTQGCIGGGTPKISRSRQRSARSTFTFGSVEVKPLRTNQQGHPEAPQVFSFFVAHTYGVPQTSFTVRCTRPPGSANGRCKDNSLHRSVTSMCGTHTKTVARISVLRSGAFPSLTATTFLPLSRILRGHGSTSRVGESRLSQISPPDRSCHIPSANNRNGINEPTTNHSTLQDVARKPSSEPNPTLGELCGTSRLCEKRLSSRPWLLG